MAHDFVRFPELTNAEMSNYYFESPHRQITEDFRARVVKIHDGDTITLLWEGRDFEFPLRFSDIAAPELNENGGIESRDWLKKKILEKEVDIIIDKNNRVEKWGRLLGKVYFEGLNMGEQSILAGKSVSWTDRNDGVWPSIDKMIGKVWE